MKYSDETLQSWTKPLSKTEEQRVENTVGMINNALKSSEKLKTFNIEVFAQGSYANNTNVRQNSDVDICVMLTSLFFCNYVVGKTDADYGFNDEIFSFSEYKSYVIDAINQKFGADSVKIKNKSIKIASNSYHVNADVVPSVQYRNYNVLSSIDPDVYVEGIRFWAKDGTKVINYPKSHIQNGRKKNVDTNYSYKKLVRILKHIRNDMIADDVIDEERITSFLIECLAWNLSNDVITKYETWGDTIKNSIVYLWDSFQNENEIYCSWKEVSGYISLFHNERKWSIIDVQEFLNVMWTYLEY